MIPSRISFTILSILVASSNVSAFAPSSSLSYCKHVRSLTVPMVPVMPVIKTSKLTTNGELAPPLKFMCVMQRQRILYPGSVPDSSHAEPVPPGQMDGCPWIGSISMYSNPNKFVHNKAAKIANPPPKMFKFFAFAKPMVVLVGSSAIKKVLSREFKKKDGGVSQYVDFGQGKYTEMMFGTESMSFETDESKKYHFLQKLVGQALTPQSVAKGMPFLQRASEEAVDKMLASDEVVTSEITHHLTLDVAWRQIIGLDLKDDQEIEDFHSAVEIWQKAITSNYFLVMFPIPAWLLKLTKEYKAKSYLTRLIDNKIDDLEKNGPDGSTMSAMVFAVDDDDQSKKLTRQQVIDNIFLLLFAGSETSSLTLTNAMLFLGMNPGVWEKLVAEQKDLVAKNGEALTKKHMDNECPYLDAVVKETMRIIPVSGGGVRSVKDTIVMDGVQIPKNWLAMYSISLTHEQDPKTWKADGSHMEISTGFKPERWLDDETRPNTEFIPWGAGHRFCLGHNLASAEMRTFLAVMARKVKNFDLVTDVDKIKWKEGVILTPKDGVVVNAHANPK
mmetsp:Transcript_11554/g.16713  ORF Transcript_11554/g.16713 Transcript_11554/m.16713 type:complete len:558 (-) Transcript_11554:121-1794(-)